MNLDTNLPNEAAESFQSESSAPVAKKKNSYGHLMTGLWLILIGIAWLLWNFDLINWAWMERYGFILLGSFLLIKNIITKKYQVVTGLFFVLIGCFHLYLDRQYDYEMHHLWPLYLILAGIAYFVNFVINTRRWFSLVAGLTLIGFGAIHLSRSFWFVPYDLVLAVKLYWPLTFVLAGVILLTIALVKNRRNA